MQRPQSWRRWPLSLLLCAALGGHARGARTGTGSLIQGLHALKLSSWGSLLQQPPGDGQTHLTVRQQQAQSAAATRADVAARRRQLQQEADDNAKGKEWADKARALENKDEADAKEAEAHAAQDAMKDEKAAEAASETAQAIAKAQSESAATQPTTTRPAPQLGYTNPKGVPVCVNFVKERLSKGYAGEALIGDFTATCTPAVISGVGMENYHKACNEISRIARVELVHAAENVRAGINPESNGLDVHQLCMQIMSAFQEFGPGSVGGR